MTYFLNIESFGLNVFVINKAETFSNLATFLLLVVTSGNFVVGVLFMKHCFIYCCVLEYLNLKQIFSQWWKLESKTTTQLKLKKTTKNLWNLINGKTIPKSVLCNKLLDNTNIFNGLVRK